VLSGCRDYCPNVVTRLVFLQSAQYSGFDLRHLCRRHACRCSASAKSLRQFLNGFVPFASIQLQTAARAPIAFIFASDQFNFAVRSASLRQLFGSRVSDEISFCAMFQFAMNSLVIRIPASQQTLSQRGPC
jgi:hypothetical protein